MRLTLDTNVLVCAADRDAGPKHAQAVAIVARAADADCVLTLQCLGEFFHVSTRKGGLEARAAVALVQRFRQVFPVVVATETAFEQAMDAACRHSLTFWDAMLWATAREAGCRMVLSEDFQDGRTLEGVTFLNPFVARNRALVDQALGLARP